MYDMKSEESAHYDGGGASITIVAMQLNKYQSLRYCVQVYYASICGDLLFLYLPTIIPSRIPA